MTSASGHRRRVVHPGAWWMWATAMAVAIATTTNPVLLALVLAVVVLTVVARRPYAPWARSLRLYAALGAFVVVSRVVLHVLVGMKTSDTIVLPLPQVELPEWARGITLLGPVGLGGLVGAFLEGLRLATMLFCFGAANALANPKRLLAATPPAVRDIGTATVIALSVAPQLVESVQRVRKARVLRGDARRATRVKQVALPVLHDTLDRSISLAASMEARGYGRRAERPFVTRFVIGVLMLGGALLTCVGVYGTMQGSGAEGVVSDVPWWTTAPVLVVGIVASVVGVAFAGRSMRRTRYRRDPWGLLEWAVVACGIVTLVAVRAVLADQPDARNLSVSPLAMPVVPLWLPLALVPALLPAFFTPEPERPRRTSAPERTLDDAAPGRDARALRGATS